MKVNVPVVHRERLLRGTLQQQMDGLGEALSEMHFQDNAVNFVFVNGEYSDFDKKMLTSCVLVNKMGKPITEIHGRIELNFRSIQGQIAFYVIDLLEPFMGVLQPDEGLFFTVNIPVKGLDADREVSYSDIAGRFEDVRVTYLEAESQQETE